MSAAPYLVKIVRDRVGAVLGNQAVTFAPVPDDDFRPLLRRKLLEEAAEYLSDPSCSELADVLEVVYALALADLGISWDDLIRERDAKRAERGSFIRGIGMFTVPFTPSSSEGSHDGEH